MPFQLHRSAIITGCVNCFCLVCESFLENRQEALCHIKTSLHRENLNAVPYLDKFKDQHIRKFKTGYYCEFCNILMPNAVRVNLHVAEDHHKQTKGTNLLKSLDRGVIAFKNVVIKERSWHGLADNVCYICEIEFEDEVIHKSDTSHILSLIKTPVQFGVNDVIYRQIKDSTIHCLTCNILLHSNSLNKHLNDAEHIDLYAKCKIGENEELKDNSEKDNNEGLRKTTTLCNDTDSKDNIKQNNSCIKERDISLIIQSNDIDINYETEIAFCRKCWAPIGFDNNDIVNHIEEHSSLERSTLPVVRYPVNFNRTKYYIRPRENEMNVECLNYQHRNFVRSIKNEQTKVVPQVKYLEFKKSQDANKLVNKEQSALEHNRANQEISNELERKSIEGHRFAKDNDITYNLNGGKAFCRTCQVQIPSSLKSMKEHTTGVPHNRNRKANKAKVNNSQRKQTVAKYVRSLKLVKSSYYSGFLINDTFFLDELSYLLFQYNIFNAHLKCLLCGSNVNPMILDTHVKKCSLPCGKKLRVILTNEHEFIREIRSETFHCGYCNLIVSGWSEMESHLQSTDHDRKKSNSILRHGVACRRLPLQALLLLEDD